MKSDISCLAIGVDGCRSGWIAVWYTEERETGFAIFSKIDFILKLQARMIMIDVPIGLRTRGYRNCDIAARGLLGRDGRSRVFLGARRGLLGYLPDKESDYKVAYQRANNWAKSADGKGISRQLFGILPKIAEVDDIMTGSRQEAIRETHPELVFKRLSGSSSNALPNKSSIEGQKLRMDLLANHGFAEIYYWVAMLRGSGAKVDDLLDACACANAALLAAEGKLQRVDCTEEQDERGLRMEICY